MKKRSLIYAIIFAVVLFIALEQEKKSRVQTEVTQNAIQAEQEADEIPEPVPPKPKLEGGTANTANIPTPLRVYPPLPEQLKDEVRKNPHGTPPSLLTFASELGRSVKAAKDEQSATTLFRELETCILSPHQKGAHSVQSLCLVGAHQLSEKFPTLGSPYAKLEAQAEPRTRQLSRIVQ